jgi:hypothetical protein
MMQAYPKPVEAFQGYAWRSSRRQWSGRRESTDSIVRPLNPHLLVVHGMRSDVARFDRLKGSRRNMEGHVGGVNTFGFQILQ